MESGKNGFAAALVGTAVLVLIVIALLVLAQTLVGGSADGVRQQLINMWCGPGHSDFNRKEGKQ
jgi:hypothetical protein